MVVCFLEIDALTENKCNDTSSDILPDKPGNHAFHKERFASGRETNVNWPYVHFSSFTLYQIKDTKTD